MNASSQPSGNSTSFIVTSALYALLLVIMFWGEGRASAQHPDNPLAAVSRAVQARALSSSLDSHQRSLPPLASAPAAATIHTKSSGLLVGMAGLMILMMRAGHSLRKERSSFARRVERA
jgi:hypothetical protein